MHAQTSRRPYSHLRRPRRRLRGRHGGRRRRSPGCAERRPEQLTALDLAVLSAATFKAARTVAHDEVTSFLREPFVQGEAHEGDEKPVEDGGAAAGDRRAASRAAAASACGRRPALVGDCTPRAAHRPPADVVARRRGRERLPAGRLRRADGKANELEQQLDQELQRRPRLPCAANAPSRSCSSSPLTFVPAAHAAELTVSPRQFSPLERRAAGARGAPEDRARRRPARDPAGKPRRLARHAAAAPLPEAALERPPQRRARAGRPYRIRLVAAGRELASSPLRIDRTAPTITNFAAHNRGSSPFQGDNEAADDHLARTATGCGSRPRSASRSTSARASTSRSPGRSAPPRRSTS